MTQSALIVGAGRGLSASLARLFASHGIQVALAARRVDKLAPLCAEIGATPHACDATNPEAVAALFDAVAGTQGDPSIVVYNASARAAGAITDIEPEAVARAIAVTAFGGFLVAQQAAKRMLAHNAGNILFTGASASVKGYVHSAAFAMGKFALRGLAQSMARELAPQGIHVSHFVIDGGIRSATRPDAANHSDRWLDPDAIAEAYWQMIQQKRSAWTWEQELRPWTETF